VREILQATPEGEEWAAGERGVQKKNKKKGKEVDLMSAAHWNPELQQEECWD